MCATGRSGVGKAGSAAEAVRGGRGLTALRLARAASEIARLDALFEWVEYDPAEQERDAAAGQCVVLGPGLLHVVLAEQAIPATRVEQRGQFRDLGRSSGLAHRQQPRRRSTGGASRGINPVQDLV